jgi:hypothetical protein
MRRLEVLHSVPIAHLISLLTSHFRAGFCHVLRVGKVNVCIELILPSFPVAISLNRKSWRVIIRLAGFPLIGLRRQVEQRLESQVFRHSFGQEEDLLVCLLSIGYCATAGVEEIIH